MTDSQRRGGLVLGLICVLICSAYAQRYEAHHSFKTPFLLVRGTYLPYWEFGGSAVITDEYVRLTPAVKSRAGSVWNSEPVAARNWEVIMEFRIGGGGKQGADGLAVWYTPEPNQEGPVFGSKDKWRGLAVIFDSFDNDGMRDNPQIVAIWNDGTREFIEDGRNIQFGGCHAQFRNPYKNVRAKIKNVGGYVEVLVDTVGNGIWEPCVSPTRMDLPLNHYFGVTAATGGLFDNHDVYSFETFDLDETEAYRPPLPRNDDRDLQQQAEEQQRRQQQEQQQREQQQQQQREQYDREQNNRPQDVYNQPPPVDYQQQAQPTQQVHQQPAHQQPPHAGGQGQVQPPPANYNQPRSESSPTGNSAVLEQLTTITELLKDVNPEGLRSQLERLRQQQAILAEAFGDLVKLVPSRGDNEDVKTRLDILQQSLSRDITDTKNSLADVKAIVNTRIGSKNDDITKTLDDIKGNVNSLKHGLDQQTQNTKEISANLKTNVQEFSQKIEKHGTFGFWTYFLFVQAIFLFGYIYWRKHKDDANKKFM